MDASVNAIEPICAGVDAKDRAQFASFFNVAHLKILTPTVLFIIRSPPLLPLPRKRPRKSRRKKVRKSSQMNEKRVRSSAIWLFFHDLKAILTSIVFLTEPKAEEPKAEEPKEEEAPAAVAEETPAAEDSAPAVPPKDASASEAKEVKESSIVNQLKRHSTYKWFAKKVSPPAEAKKEGEKKVEEAPAAEEPVAAAAEEPAAASEEVAGK